MITKDGVDPSTPASTTTTELALNKLVTPSSQSRKDALSFELKIIFLNKHIYIQRIIGITAKLPQCLQLPSNHTLLHSSFIWFLSRPWDPFNSAFIWYVLMRYLQ